MLESIFSNLTPNYCESIDKPYLQVMIEEEEEFNIEWWKWKMKSTPRAAAGVRGNFHENTFNQAVRLIKLN